MNVVLILLAASLLIAIGFLIAFIWSVKSGQYDDDYTPSVRMLFDDTKTFLPNDSTSDSRGKTTTEHSSPKASGSAHPNKQH